MFGICSICVSNGFETFESRQKFKNPFTVFFSVVPKIKNLDIPPITTEQDTLKKEVEEEDSKDFKMKLIAKFIEDEKLALQAMDGFLLVLSNDGDVTFVSENINDILGLSKVIYSKFLMAQFALNDN